jgi:hypothetical protein
MTKLLVLGWAVLGAVPAESFHAEGPEWTVDASLASAGTLQIDVKARAGFHLNEEYPLNFRPKVSEGVKFARARFDRGDGMTFQPCSPDAGHACAVRVPASFARQGKTAETVDGTLAFSACSEERCIIQKVDITLRLASP